MTRVVAIAAVLWMATYSAGPALAQVSEIPDPELTPGKVATSDPAQICARGKAGTYSQSHRQTTAAMKAEVYERYGMTAHSGEWEVDHLVPLCLGGADDIENLWPQPGNGHGAKWTFHDKDKLEAELCRGLCHDHVIKAGVAQSFLVNNGKNWPKVYCQYYPNDKRCDE